MASTNRKLSDSESSMAEENEELAKDSLKTEELGRGKRNTKASRKLIMSEDDKQVEAARLKKIAKLATFIQEPKKISLKTGSSIKQTGRIQQYSNKTEKSSA